MKRAELDWDPDCNKTLRTAIDLIVCSLWHQGVIDLLEIQLVDELIELNPNVLPFWYEKKSESYISFGVLAMLC